MTRVLSKPAAQLLSACPPHGDSSVWAIFIERAAALARRESVGTEFKDAADRAFAVAAVAGVASLLLSLGAAGLLIVRAPTLLPWMTALAASLSLYLTHWASGRQAHFERAAHALAALPASGPQSYEVLQTLASQLEKPCAILQSTPAKDMTNAHLGLARGLVKEQRRRAPFKTYLDGKRRC
jgi:hypothetical protein